ERQAVAAGTIEEGMSGDSHESESSRDGLNAAYVLAEVAAERDRQDAKWGEQNHREGTGYAFARRRVQARRDCQAAFTEGVGTWTDVLAEEFYEALAETNPEK